MIRSILAKQLSNVKHNRKQVDVLATIQKPGTLLQVTPVNLLPLMYCNDARGEQRLITKEHIATHRDLILWFNPLNTQVL